MSIGHRPTNSLSNAGAAMMLSSNRGTKQSNQDMVDSIANSAKE